ncbi:hypothetical protein VTK56DRAFT_3442 [Thermocarpiscus australiensis]
MTVVGHLTTTFRVPSSCTSSAAQLYQVWSGSDSSYVQGPLFTPGSDCFPSGYDPAPTNYYSPGFCPHGYTTACSSLTTVSVEMETAVICCPTNLDYTCLASPSTSQGQSQQPSLACTTTWTSALAVMQGVTVVTNGEVGSTTVASESAGGITAYGIQVRFRSGDPTVAPTTGDGIAIITRTSSPTISIPTQLLIPAPTSSPSAGISTPAAIGIGVGSAVAALILAGLLGLFFFLRWRRKKGSSSSLSSPPPVPPKELPATPVPYRTVTPPYELSEDVSPRRAHSVSASKRHLSAASPASLGKARGRGETEGEESGVLGGYNPAELEADMPRAASLRDRASPESESSGWTDRQARGATMPMPWI